MGTFKHITTGKHTRIAVNGINNRSSHLSARKPNGILAWSTRHVATIDEGIEWTLGREHHIPSNKVLSSGAASDSNATNRGHVARFVSTDSTVNITYYREKCKLFLSCLFSTNLTSVDSGVLELHPFVLAKVQIVVQFRGGCGVFFSIRVEFPSKPIGSYCEI